MSKSRIYALDDLDLHPHTWTKGLDYELIQKDNRFILASNEGQLNYTGVAKEKLSDLFRFE